MRTKLTLAIYEQFLASGSSFLFTIILARSLSEQLVGLYFSFNLFFLLCQSIQHSVISAPAYSLVPRLSSLSIKQLYLKFLISRQFILSLFFLLLYMVACRTLMQPSSQLLHFTTYVYYGFVLLALLTFDFIRKWMIANRTYKNLAIFSSLRYFIQLGLILLMYIFDYITLNRLAIVLLLAALLSLIVETINQRIYPNIFLSTHQHLDKSIASKHRTVSLDLLPAAIMQWTSGGTYELQALKLLGPSVFAVIKIVQSFVSPLNLLNQIAENWLIVLFAPKNSVKNRTQIRSLNFNLILLSTLVLCTVVYVINLFAPYVLAFFYGQEYFEFGFLVTGYLIVLILVIINTTVRSYLTAHLSTSTIKFAYGVSTALAFASSYALVHHLKLYGVLIGGILSQIVLLIVMLFSAFSVKSK